MAPGRNGAQATLLGIERSRHCANIASLKFEYLSCRNIYYFNQYHVIYFISYLCSYYLLIYLFIYPLPFREY